MSLKAKLAMGVMTGALGLSLVGGGTYAAFTDTESVSNTFAAGELDIKLKQQDGTTNLGSELFTTNLKNLKPGDSITKTIRVKNAGTLSVNQVFVKADYDDFVDGGANIDGDPDLGGENGPHAFADQIDVKITGKSGHVVYNNTLKHLKDNSSSDITDSTTNGALPAMPSKDTDPVTITLTFNGEADNTYMKDSMNINFHFEATQHAGTNFNDGDDINFLNGSQE
ncbi:hypothetical protein N780_09485 [Pontibacillus chungwhensis BH030062]|uniref:Cell division protein FtsN n=1 Tax=Pontibacillus chungwhensis BH030062 TaxID=1385513 RepID=A0A0A2V855_9BACI|nr:TasA family protein [Pontibacillus chungwhensis]KGP89870.1 hypothetical protein N780_09485 [Pontibacillus chungwhensis BH030062]